MEDQCKEYHIFYTFIVVRLLSDRILYAVVKKLLSSIFYISNKIIISFSQTLVRNAISDIFQIEEPDHNPEMPYMI